MSNHLHVVLKTPQPNLARGKARTGIATPSESSPISVGITHSGDDASNMNAGGTKGTSGDTYTFTEGETGSDNFSLAKAITGTLNGSAQVVSSFGPNTNGSCAGCSSSSSYATNTYNSITESNHRDLPPHRNRLPPPIPGGITTTTTTRTAGSIFLDRPSAPRVPWFDPRAASTLAATIGRA